MNEAPAKRSSVNVKLDDDLWLALRRHRAETGETVSDALNRVVRHAHQKLRAFKDANPDHAA
jgi:hypothetical protein